MFSALLAFTRSRLEATNKFSITAPFLHLTFNQTNNTTDYIYFTSGAWALQARLPFR